MNNSYRITVYGQEIHIHLYGGLVAQLDANLAHLVDTRPLTLAMTSTNTYVIAGGKPLHHLVMEELHPGFQPSRSCIVDHISGNGLDCRALNLRKANPSINQYNSVDRPNATGVRGVTRQRDGRYRAQITVQNRVIYLGAFATLLEAAATRHAAEAHYLPGGLPLHENPLFRWACPHGHH